MARKQWISKKNLAPKYHGYSISGQSYEFYLHLAKLDNVDFTMSHTVGCLAPTVDCLVPTVGCLAPTAAEAKTCIAANSDCGYWIHWRPHPPPSGWSLIRLKIHTSSFHLSKLSHLTGKMKNAVSHTFFH